VVLDREEFQNMQQHELRAIAAAANDTAMTKRFILDQMLGIRGMLAMKKRAVIQAAPRFFSRW
jgi:hypothetical protein